MALLAGVVGPMAGAALPFPFEPVGGSLLRRWLESLVAQHAQGSAATFMQNVHVGVAVGPVAPPAIPIEQWLMRSGGSRLLPDFGMAFLASAGRILGPEHGGACTEHHRKQERREDPGKEGHGVGHLKKGPAKGTGITHLNVRFMIPKVLLPFDGVMPVTNHP